MKKYIGLLIVLGILTFGATKVQAVVSVDNNMGCLPSYRYSPITGQPCLGSTLPVDQATPSVTVLSPNGGETFLVGQKITVRWTSQNFPKSLDDVFVALHQNGGWENVVYLSGSTKNDGSESFVVPNVTPGNYKIRIGNASAVVGQDYSDNFFTINNISSTLDKTPRIMYWYGKVNQHVDVNGNWQTDPDGISGADLDKLTYCKKWFPRTIRVEDYKLETTNGWRNRGNVDAPYTSTKMSTKCVQREGMVIPIPVDNPVISGISGPQFLDVNSVGTWKVEAYNPTGGNLSYKVDWGDTYEYCPVGGPCTRALSLVEAPFGQSATFTHRYLRDGVYNPTFTVRNDKGGTATTSLSVKVGKTDSKPSITIISPNGGESYTAGQQIKLKWKTNNVPSSYKVIFMLHQPSTSSSYGSIAYTENDGLELITLPTASEFSGMKYGNNFKILASVEVPEGSIGVIDFSDNLFTIKDPNEVNPQPNAPSIRVLSPNGGEIFSGVSGTTVKWSSYNIPSSSNIKIVIHDLSNNLPNFPATVFMADTSNDGQEFITFPAGYGNSFIVEVKEATGTYQVSDKSDGVFSIIDKNIQPSPITTYEDCAPGSVYSRTTGQKCLTTQVQSNIQSSSTKKIVKGTISNEVKTVQSALTKQGYPLTTDGNFGPKTEEAVKKFQTMKGLPVTGIIDDKTMSLLLSYILEL